MCRCSDELDLAAGTVPLINEASHLPELFSVILVWLVAVPAPKCPARTSGSAAACLRVAGNDDKPRCLRRWLRRRVKPPPLFRLRQHVGRYDRTRRRATARLGT